MVVSRFTPVVERSVLTEAVDLTVEYNTLFFSRLFLTLRFQYFFGEKHGTRFRGSNKTLATTTNILYDPPTSEWSCACYCRFYLLVTWYDFL